MGFLFSKKSKTVRGFSYYDRENLVHNLKELISITDTKSTLQFTTAENIKYKDLSLNEIDEKWVLNTFDKPDFTIKDFEALNNYRVLFYRHLVGKFNFLLQFHFYKDNFFFVSNNVTTAGPLNRPDKELFINRLASKYALDLKLDSQQDFDIKITDKINNFITINDSVSFRVSYINYATTSQQILNNPDFLEENPDEDIETQIDEFF